MLYLYLTLTLLFASIIAFGAFRQKDIFNKILFLNVATSTGALFICFLGTIRVNSSFIDIALIYFLLSIVANCAYLKYFMQKDKHEKESR